MFSALSKSVVTVKRDSQVPNLYMETNRPHLQARVSVNTDIVLAHEKPNEETSTRPRELPWEVCRSQNARNVKDKRQSGEGTGRTLLLT